MEWAWDWNQRRFRHEILYVLHCDATHALVTEDRRIHDKAKARALKKGRESFLKHSQARGLEEGYKALQVSRLLSILVSLRLGMPMASAKEQMLEVLRNQPDDELLRELAFVHMVEEGLADSDAGRTISHEDMLNRIRSWQR